MKIQLLIITLTSVVGLTAADTRIIDAAKRGDVAAVRKLCAQKIDVNVAGADSSTAIYWAVYQDDLEMATALVDAGADISTPNRYGMTPLMLAATNGNAAIIKLLLDANANPNTRLPEGETVLMTASRTGRLEAVKTLLAAGADVNAVEEWRGQTALMWAAAEGNAQVVEALLAAGADMGAKTKVGFTAFLLAVREGHIPVVKTMLKAGAHVNEAFKGGPGERMKASSGSFTAPASGSTALHLAVANAHYELAALLIENGADVNSGGPGWTVLHSLVWTRKLGQGNNNPEPQGSGNMDSLSFVRFLKTKGANFNAKIIRPVRVGQSVLNTLGGTPFWLAGKGGDIDYMRLLIEMGADASIKNADETTALMVAAGLGTRSPGEDAGTEDEAVVAVKYVLELGNDINAVDKNGETAMHGAAYKQFPKVVELLAQRGAKIEIWNTKNKSGWTPLRIAAGVFRTANFRFSDPTADALRKVMTAAGVSTYLEPGPDVQNLSEPRTANRGNPQ